MEFFALTNSNAAPWFSDTGTRFVEAEDPKEALRIVRAEYTHPAGLYAVNIYRSSDDYHKNKQPVAQWMSLRAEQRTKGVDCKVCGAVSKACVLNSTAYSERDTDVHECANGHRTLVDSYTGEVIP